MGDHSLNSPTGRPEPVVLFDIGKGLIAALVATGWITLDDQTVAMIGTGAGLVLFVVLTIITRSKVTPTSDPLAADGSELQPVGEILARFDLDDDPPVG